MMLSLKARSKYYIAALCVLSCSVMNLAHGVNGSSTWVAGGGAGNPNWDSVPNWLGGVIPHGAGQIAVFGTQFAGSATSLNSPTTIGSVFISSIRPSWSIGSQSLTFSNAPHNAVIFNECPIFSLNTTTILLSPLDVYLSGGTLANVRTLNAGGNTITLYGNSASQLVMNNSFTAPIVCNGGSFVVAPSDATSTLTSAVVNNGTMEVTDASGAAVAVSSLDMEGGIFEFTYAGSGIASTITGPVTMNNGVFNFDSIASGSGTPTILGNITINNGTFNFTTTDVPATISGSITLNNGTLNLSPQTTMAVMASVTGNITINGGAATIGAPMNGTLDLVSSPQINVSGGTLGFGFSGSSGGAPTVTISHEGSVNLGGTSQGFQQLIVQDNGNCFGGGTLSTGVVSMGGGLINNTTLQMNSLAPVSITYNPTLSSSVEGVSSPATIQNTVIQVSPSITLNVMPGANNAHYDLYLKNSSITAAATKSGNGTLLIDGTPSLSGLIIDAGTVMIGFNMPATVSGSGQTVTVSAGGTLSGNGTLGTAANVTVVNNGTVIPGTSQNANALSAADIGTLTISGPYSQTGTLVIKALSVGSSDLLAITDMSAATLMPGSTLQFVALEGSTLAAGDMITVLSTAPSMLSGTFTHFNAVLPANLTATLLYDPNTNVIVQISNCSGSGPTPPSPSPPLPAPSLTTYINLGSSAFTSITEYNIRLERRLNEVRRRMSARAQAQTTTAAEQRPIQFDTEGLLATTYPMEAFTSTDKRSKKEQIDSSRFRRNAPNEPASLYFAALGSIGDVKKISHQNGYDFNSIGGLIGFDYALSRVGIGLQVLYEQLAARVDKHWGNFDIQTVFGNAYGTFLPFGTRHFFLDLAAGGGNNWYDIHRHTDGGIAKGKPEGWDVDGYAGIGYDAWHKGFRFTPLTSVQYIDLTIARYKEHGAHSDDASVGKQKFQSLRSWLGASMGGKAVCDSSIWMPEVRGYWLHEFHDLNKKLQIASVDFGTSSRLQVLGGKRNFGVVGAELRGIIGRHLTLEASYDFYWNPEIRAHLLYGELGADF